MGAWLLLSVLVGLAGVQDAPAQEKPLIRPETIRVLGLSINSTRADVRRRVGDKAWKASGAVTKDGRNGYALVVLQDGFVSVTGYAGAMSAIALKPTSDTHPVSVGMGWSDVVKLLGGAGTTRAPVDGEGGSPGSPGSVTHVYEWDEPKCSLEVEEREGHVAKVTLVGRDRFLEGMQARAAEFEERMRRLEDKRRSQPDFGLVLRRSSGFVSYPKGRTPDAAVSATVMGVVRNYRSEAADITVRVEWTSKNGSYAGAASILLERVAPGEERDFRVESYEVFRPHVYRVTLAAPPTPEPE